MVSFNSYFDITRGQNKDGKLENPKGISMGTSSIALSYIKQVLMEKIYISVGFSSTPCLMEDKQVFPGSYIVLWIPRLGELKS